LPGTPEQLRTPAQGSAGDCRYFPALPGSAANSQGFPRTPWQLRTPGQRLGLPGISQDSRAVMGTCGNGPGLPWIAQALLAAQDCRAALGTPEDLPALRGGAANSKGVPRTPGRRSGLYNTPWQLRQQSRAALGTPQDNPGLLPSHAGYSQ
jgi:hypothetical protein